MGPAESSAAISDDVRNLEIMILRRRLEDMGAQCFVACSNGKNVLVVHPKPEGAAIHSSHSKPKGTAEALTNWN